MAAQVLRRLFPLPVVAGRHFVLDSALAHWRFGHVHARYFFAIFTSRVTKRASRNTREHRRKRSAGVTK